MPEIGEVARIVSYIHKHLVGKTLLAVKAQHDENVFGKVGTTAAEFEKALIGKKVLDAKQQGKYFWLVMSTPPHPLCHFGMAGWFKIRDDETAYYKPTKAVDQSEWPPKYWKFAFETLETPKVEAAFVDFRRFARVRLIDCPADEIRNNTPLKENGPDPVVDKDIVTVEWLSEKMRSKKIPVKALLLDQANISGIGNWVGDELLYDACIHPEQYSNTLTDAQIKQIHKSLHYVCSLAVETKADSSKFPETWLFKHRWGKGKKDSPNRLPNGEKIVFLTVGGRTSAVIPSVQKKTGPVKADVKIDDQDDENEDDDEAEKKPKKAKKQSLSNRKKVKVEATVPETKSNLNLTKPTHERDTRTTKPFSGDEPALSPRTHSKRKHPTAKPKSALAKDSMMNDEKEKNDDGKERVYDEKDNDNEEGEEEEKKLLNSDLTDSLPSLAKRQKTTKTKAGGKKQVNGTSTTTSTKPRSDRKGKVAPKVDPGSETARRRSARVNGGGA